MEWDSRICMHAHVARDPRTKTIAAQTKKSNCPYFTGGLFCSVGGRDILLMWGNQLRGDSTRRKGCATPSKVSMKG
jgi:hypothetical protein